jgi:CBS domain-containing protein
MRVEEALLTTPTVHAPSATVGELRRFFADDHVHMALVVESGLLLAVVERQDLDDSDPDELPAALVGSLAGRTTAPDAPLSVVLQSMRLTGRRRLAVTDDEGRLLGLLCRKATGRGFCSDEDVAGRRRWVSRARVNS